MTFKIPISRIIIEIILNSKNALIAIISLLFGFKVKALQILKKMTFKPIQYMRLVIRRIE